MALDKVVNDILESAQREADQRIQVAEAEREKILLEADQKIERIQKAGNKDLQENIARLRRQELSSAELEAKKLVLNQRKAVLDQAFQETLQELWSMNPKEKSAIYKKIIASGKKVIHHPKVFCPKGEADLLSGLRGCESLNETEMESGIILESEDGKVRLDYRFRTILENIWESELKSVSNILFE